MKENRNDKKNKKIHTRPPDIRAIKEREILSKALREGDGEAFGNFYVNNADSLITFLTRIIGNEEDAKEVVQDTFVMLWENCESINPHTTIEGFLFGTAKNLAFRMIRARGRESDFNREIGMMQEEYADLADGELITEEMALLIDSVVKRMPPKRREVFELSRNEGLTYNEIAERLDITYGTVRTHIEAAKSEIRSVLSIALAILLIFH